MSVADAPTGTAHDAESTFAGLWDTAVATWPDCPFLVFADDSGARSEWTYREFDEAVSRMQALFATAGVKAGSAVHVALRNCPAFVAIWIAAARTGAWIVPVDPESKPPQLALQLDRTRPVLGFYGIARRESYLAAATERPMMLRALNEAASDLFAATTDRPARPPLRVRPNDLLAVLFTSGTTSQPKGVLLTQQNYAYAATAMAMAAELTREHRWFVSLPLFHANAQYYCFAPAIRVGASVALASQFSASRWLTAAQELAVTHASLFAAPIRMILARTGPDSTAAHLRHVWFAQSLGKEHFARFADLVGCRPRQLYGMTETLAAVTCNPVADPRPDSIGRPLPGRSVRLGSDDLPDGPAVMSVYGIPGRDLFLGYLDDPERTREAFQYENGDGVWFTTGDVMRRRPDGALDFVGRADDIIKVSGENVSLSEVEAIMAQAPGVLEVAVVGRPDPVRDVVPVAYVVAADKDVGVTIDTLHAWAAANLPPSARPREFTEVDSLPRTSVGKIQRFALDTG